MKKTIPVPAITASVSPSRVVYNVEVDGDKSDFPWMPNLYSFSIDAQDATVVIDDNVFSSKDVAAKALKAMADFLSKK